MVGRRHKERTAPTPVSDLTTIGCPSEPDTVSGHVHQTPEHGDPPAASDTSSALVSGEELSGSLTDADPSAASDPVGGHPSAVQVGHQSGRAGIPDVYAATPQVHAAPTVATAWSRRWVRGSWGRPFGPDEMKTLMFSAARWPLPVLGDPSLLPSEGGDRTQSKPGVF